MTEIHAPRPSFGRALGQTARQIGKLHQEALASHATDFPSWMLLTLLHEQPAALTADQVAAELHRRMDLSEPESLALLRRSAASGLVEYEAEAADSPVTLTERGAAHFAAVYAHSRAVTDAASAGVDAEALEAAVTVLMAVEERATSLLAD